MPVLSTVQAHAKVGPAKARPVSTPAGTAAHVPSVRVSANSIITAANAPTARKRRAVIQSMCPVTTSAARTGVAVMA